MFSLFNRKARETGFALLFKIGYRAYAGPIELKLTLNEEQKVNKKYPFHFYTSKERAFTEGSFDLLQASFHGRPYEQIIRDSSLVLITYEVLRGTPAHPKKLKILNIEAVTRSQVDPNYQEKAFEVYVPRKAEEMPQWDTKVKIYSEEEIEEQSIELTDLSEFNLNQCHPDFIKKIVKENHPWVTEEDAELTTINGRTGVLLGGTYIDGGKGMPSLDWVYNLKCVESFPSTASYSSELYVKIDETKVAFAFYSPDSGANDDPPYFVIIN